MFHDALVFFAERWGIIVKKIKPIHLYLALNLLGITLFIVLNRISNGYYFEQIFYNLTGDALYDFFVFLNQTSTSAISFAVGSNPPLVRLIFRFIFKSLPESTQELYTTVNLWPNSEYDLRVNAFAFLCFWIMFTFAIVLLAKLCIENLEGTSVQKKLFVGLSLLSTGVIWAVERGNIVIWAVVCTMYFCFNYEKTERLSREISYLSLGIAISLKIYPVLFCILLLKQKKYKEILKVIVYVIILTVFPILISGGFDALFAYIGTLFNQASVSSNLRAGYLNGLSIMLTFSRALGIESAYMSNIVFFRILNYVFCIVLSIVVVYLVNKKWIQLTALVFAMFLLPGITHTYMLAFVSIPLILFLNEERKMTLQNILALLGFLLLTTILPITNGAIVESLRDPIVVNVANRLSGIMLIHVLGELILACIIFSEIIKAIIKLKKPVKISA